MLVRAECCRCFAKFDLAVEKHHALGENDFVIGFECPACATGEQEPAPNAEPEPKAGG